MKTVFLELPAGNKELCHSSLGYFLGPVTFLYFLGPVTFLYFSLHGMGMVPMCGNSYTTEGLLFTVQATLELPIYCPSLQMLKAVCTTMPSPHDSFSQFLSQGSERRNTPPSE